ncbi:hypothetical protein ABZ379_31050 [Streptomyces canus]|uniref:hypothetical protein n=1 Tax=Streptomyces canus TaxID=58343 RepID=UPI0033FF2F20
MSVDAELRINEGRGAGATEVTVVVRSLRGPVHLGARFSPARAHELSPTVGEAGREVMPVIQGDDPAAP